MSDGPRLLTDADRLDESRTRVVMNDPTVRITAPIGTEARFDEARWEEIQRKTEERGRTQRGIPRARDPSRYPLSCRLVDLTEGCGSILYGLQNGGRSLYKCGRYMKTEGAECASNAVDAEAMLRFTLRTLRQLVDRRGDRDRLRALLEERALRDRADPSAAPDVLGVALTAPLAELQSQLEVVSRRMAKEDDDARYEAIAREYDRLHREVRSIEAALKSERRASAPGRDAPVQDEVEAAMSLLDDIQRITSDEEARAEINPLLEVLGVRVGLTFGASIKGKKRAVRRLLGGVIAFGGVPLPVRLHGVNNKEVPATPPGLIRCSDQGGPEDVVTESNEDSLGLGRVIERPGNRPGSSECWVGSEAVGVGDRAPASAVRNQSNPIRPSRRRPEGISITKVSRGDKTALELFVAGVASWCSAIREHFIDITPPSIQGLWSAKHCLQSGVRPSVR